MSDRIEDIYEQVINENSSDPLRRFAELLCEDEHHKFCNFLMRLHNKYKNQHNHFHVAAVNFWEKKNES